MEMRLKVQAIDSPGQLLWLNSVLLGRQFKCFKWGEVEVGWRDGFGEPVCPDDCLRDRESVRKYCLRELDYEYSY
jgi:hypothetical protein